MESLRVYYVERQRLVAADLHSEQEYLSGLGERHNLCQHGPGIVRGLHISVDNAKRQWVEPGIAIDSSGRELLLGQREPITVDDANKCADVWLVYCRQPLRLRQAGRSACSPNTFQRWTEIPRVFVVAAKEEQPPEPPVEDAVFLGRINCDDPQPRAYTALHGGEVANPGGRAPMQVGPRTAHDADSFVLNIEDVNGNPARRIGIDRRQNNSFNGTLELLGYYESIIIPVPQQTTLLMVEPAKLRETVLIEMEGIESAGKVEIRLNFRHGAKPLVREQFTFDPADQTRDEKLENFNRDSTLAKLSVLTELPPMRGQRIRLQSLRAGQHSALTSWGGTLELGDWPEPDEAHDNAQAQEEKRYGCYDSPVGVVEDDAEPTGLSFLPVAQPPKGAPLPRIYSAVTTSGDRTVEQLRFDLGEKKNIDYFGRLSIGAWPDDKSKFTALTIDGTCRLALTSENKQVPNTLVSMIVTGSIEQTIKPDPTDPVFANLLVAAYTYGLRSSALATTDINVTIQNLPNPLLIETRKPWHYNVHLQNGEANTVHADLLLETLGTALPKPLRTNIDINGKQSVDIPVNHSAGEVPPGDLDIKIVVSGKVGKVFWVKEATALKIPVVETPRANLSDVPDSVPPSSDWSHTLRIENLAPRGMTLLEVRRAEGIGVVESLLPAPVELPAQQSKQFGPFAHPGGITGELDVSLFVRYRWENGPEETITSEPQTIKVKTQLVRPKTSADELIILPAPQLSSNSFSRATVHTEFCHSKRDAGGGSCKSFATPLISD